MNLHSTQLRNRLCLPLALQEFHIDHFIADHFRLWWWMLLMIVRMMRIMMLVRVQRIMGRLLLFGIGMRIQMMGMMRIV